MKTGMLIVIILITSTKAVCQHSIDSVSLIVTRYKDTILKNENDYTVYLKLTNNSHKPISWNSNEFQVYFRAFYLNGEHDTISDKGFYDHADIQFGINRVNTIRPGASIELKANTSSYVNWVGNIKIKFGARFSFKDDHAAETSWIRQHVSFSYNDFLKNWW